MSEKLARKSITNQISYVRSIIQAQGVISRNEITVITHSIMLALASYQMLKQIGLHPKLIENEDLHGRRKPVFTVRIKNPEDIGKLLQYLHLDYYDLVSAAQIM